MRFSSFFSYELLIFENTYLLAYDTITESGYFCSFIVQWSGTGICIGNICWYLKLGNQPYIFICLSVKNVTYRNGLSEISYDCIESAGSVL